MARTVVATETLESAVIFEIAPLLSVWAGTAKGIRVAIVAMGTSCSCNCEVHVLEDFRHRYGVPASPCPKERPIWPTGAQLPGWPRGRAS